MAYKKPAIMRIRLGDRREVTKLDIINNLLRHYGDRDTINIDDIIGAIEEYGDINKSIYNILSKEFIAKGRDNISIKKLKYDRNCLEILYMIEKGVKDRLYIKTMGHIKSLCGKRNWRILKKVAIKKLDYSIVGSEEKVTGRKIRQIILAVAAGLRRDVIVLDLYKYIDSKIGNRVVYLEDIGKETNKDRGFSLENTSDVINIIGLIFNKTYCRHGKCIFKGISDKYIDFEIIGIRKFKRMLGLDGSLDIRDIISIIGGDNLIYQTRTRLIGIKKSAILDIDIYKYILRQNNKPMHYRDILTGYKKITGITKDYQDLINEVRGDKSKVSRIHMKSKGSFEYKVRTQDKKLTIRGKLEAVMASTNRPMRVIEIVDVIERVYKEKVNTGTIYDYLRNKEIYTRSDNGYTMSREYKKGLMEMD